MTNSIIKEEILHIISLRHKNRRLYMKEKKGKPFLAEFALFLIVFSVIAGILGYTGYIIGKGDFAKSAPVANEKNRVLIVDAGHGGIDGGATGINGRLEKELNLEISEKVSLFSNLFGYEVINTRTSDASLGDDAPKGKRKMTDLVKRLEIANENSDAVFLSIHMNKFPQEVCRGLQIWYSPNSDMSVRLANIVKNRVQTEIQPDNTRDCKKADSSIYLLDRMKNTAVLVECGFISNKAECEALCSAEYQQKLSACLSYALLDFTNNVG